MLLTLAVWFMAWILQAQTLISKVTLRTSALVASFCTMAWHPLGAGVGITKIKFCLKYKNCIEFYWVLKNEHRVSILINSETIHKSQIY